MQISGGRSFQAERSWGVCAFQEEHGARVSLGRVKTWRGDEQAICKSDVQTYGPLYPKKTGCCSRVPSRVVTCADVQLG